MIRNVKTAEHYRWGQVCDGWRLQIQLGEQLFRLSTGDALEMPPGNPHRVQNLGQVDAAFLVVSAPSTQGDRVNVEA